MGTTASQRRRRARNTTGHTHRRAQGLTAAAHALAPRSGKYSATTAQMSADNNGGDIDGRVAGTSTGDGGGGGGRYMCDGRARPRRRRCAMAEGYDPNRSQVTDAKLASFIESPLTHHLQDVPGIGPATDAALARVGVHTPHQLIGMFLVLKTPGLAAQQHADCLWTALKNAGVRAYRSGIVQCVAEKCEILFPTMYTADDDDEGPDPGT
jgi:hypothetical protein